MTDSLIEKNALVSALVDGQLRDIEFAQAMALLDESAQARQRWHSYHLVAEAMRTGQADVRSHDADFLVRLRARLQQEPAPAALQVAPGLAKNQTTLKATARPSANDRWWRLVVGLASVAMVTVVAWQGFQGLLAPDPQLAAAPRTSPATATLAQFGAATSAGGAALVMIRDPQIDALLAAHRQFGGTSALQAPTGFLRNATFEEGAR